MIRSPASIAQMPQPAEIRASKRHHARTCDVKALVEATPISGPACR